MPGSDTCTCTHVRTAHSFRDPFACEVVGCGCEGFALPDGSRRESPEELIEHACNSAMDAAFADLKGHTKPETVVMVVIEDINAPEGQKNDCMSARRESSPVQVTELIATCLAQAMYLSKMIGKELKLIPIEQDPRGN